MRLLHGLCNAGSRLLTVFEVADEPALSIILQALQSTEMFARAWNWDANLTQTFSSAVADFVMINLSIGMKCTCSAAEALVVM